MTAIAMNTGRTPEAEAMRALTFGLQGEVFAIEADMVREILDVPPVTLVPNAPAFAGGLINVRGRVVPLADLRVSFGMERPELDGETRVIVTEIELDGERAIVGILADRVHDVTDLDTSVIEEAPRVGMRWRADFIRGIGRRGEDFIIIPDMARIFGVGATPDEVAGDENATSH